MDRWRSGTFATKSYTIATKSYTFTTESYTFATKSCAFTRGLPWRLIEGVHCPVPDSA